VRGTPVCSPNATRHAVRVREQACVCLLQIATKAGTWNAPIWTEAGQVWANDHPEIPQGESPGILRAACKPRCIQQH
jgi:hypothetical protein